MSKTKEKIVKIGIQMKNLEGKSYIKTCSYIVEDEQYYETLFHCFCRHLSIQPNINAYFFIGSRDIKTNETICRLAENAISYSIAFS